MPKNYFMFDIVPDNSRHALPWRTDTDTHLDYQQSVAESEAKEDGREPKDEDTHSYD